MTTKTKAAPKDEPSGFEVTDNTKAVAKPSKPVASETTETVNGLTVVTYK